MNHLRILLATLLVAAYYPLSANPTAPAQDIRSLMQRVNAWQVAHPRMQPNDRNWERGTWYAGVTAAQRATGDDKFLQQALDWGNLHRWQVGTEGSGANKLFCAMTWVESYLLKRDPAMLKPTLDWLATDAPNSPGGAKVWFGHAPAPFDGPLYSDSLFAMPVFALLHKATGDPKHLETLDHFAHAVTGELFDKEEGLYYRDASFIEKKTPAGRKILWSRGNGWVFSGLPRTLECLPPDDPRREFFTSQMRTMAAALAKCQGDDGFWRPNLADPAHVPVPESSGTAFFCHGMAWGIRNGVLDKETYLPVVKKAWTALAGAVSPTGMVQWGQQVGDRPSATRQAESHEYVTGAFLLAASEVLRLTEAGLLKILHLTLGISQTGQVRWERINHRLGGGQVLRLEMNLVAHEADWRGPLRLNYFNVTEFGKKMQDRAVSASMADDPELWKDPVAYAKLTYPDAICQPQPPRMYYGAWLVDIGDPQFRSHMLEQARRHLTLLPDADGICMDRMDWLRYYNEHADDGVSWINGKPARSLFQSWIGFMDQLGPLMHQADKVIFGNTMTMRLELNRHLDGIYTEHGDNPGALNAAALMGVRKPVLGWTLDQTLQQPDPDSFFQRHLYLGVYPTAPYPGNHHCITPNPESEKWYLDYGKLMDAMRGKKWVLTPHAVSNSTLGVKVNLFQVPGGYALPVTFGGRQETATVRLQGVPGLKQAAVNALLPGLEDAVPVQTTTRRGVTELRVPLKQGCAMVTITTL